MEQYDKVVAVLFHYLEVEHYGTTTTCGFKKVCNEFGGYLSENRLDYTPEHAQSWLESNNEAHDSISFLVKRHCLDWLADLYSNGTIHPSHIGHRESAASCLNETLKNELDAYLEQIIPKRKDSNVKNACSRFMLYLQKQGLKSVSQLNYEILFDFHKQDYHVSAKCKDLYESIIRGFLHYHAEKGNCSVGLSYALNKQLLPQIVEIPIDDLNLLQNDSAIAITEPRIEAFFIEMKNIGYASTVLKTSGHILKLLNIFSDMHRIETHQSVIWYWFERVKPLLKKNWKQARRSLCQYIYYETYGTIPTNNTGDPLYMKSIDVIPQWIGNWLKEYLRLLTREGLKSSTISMQQSSNLRFCRFLETKGISSFSEITPDILKEFNMQDMHNTPEGKAAYNSRIRGFLSFLYDRGQITNPYLGKALPTISAPYTKTVEILSEQEVDFIRNVDTSILSKRRLRDYAIVSLGLYLGLRASDIVNLSFEDINWKQRKVSLIQQKTGKALTLYLPVRVGNILFQYIRDARPKSSCHKIFISFKLPYGALEPCVCQRALEQFLPNQSKAKGKFHIVRKTFATGLLQGNTKVELISDALGHSTDETVHKYISLDEERMRMCPISLNEAIGMRMEGGIFHA